MPWFRNSGAARSRRSTASESFPRDLPSELSARHASLRRVRSHRFISLMELGLSRMTAVVVYEKMAQDNLDQAQALKWVADRTDQLGAMDLTDDPDRMRIVGRPPGQTLQQPVGAILCDIVEMIADRLANISAGISPERFEDRGSERRVFLYSRNARCPW